MKRIRNGLALLLSAALLISVCLPLPAAAETPPEDSDYVWIEADQSPIASVRRGGDQSYTRINDGVLDNSTNTYSPGKDENTEDYYGYTFTNSYTINQVVFYSGLRFSDGGWFRETPVIKVLQNDVWKEIEASVSPAYDAKELTPYTFTFAPVACDGVMVSGLPGGSVHFISCAELKVAGRRADREEKTIYRYEFERYITALTDGENAEVQWMGNYGNGWSRSYQLLWKRAAGDKSLSFPFEVEAAGDYIFSAGVTTAADFGSFRFYVDDRPAGEAVDLHADSVAPKTVAEMETFTLSAGSHTLKIEALSDTAGALVGGFDYFELMRLPVCDGKTGAWIEQSQTPIASVVRDGDLALSNLGDGRLDNSTNLFEFNKTEASVDYFGYTFNKSQTVFALEYYEGPHYVDGGWFRETPTVKVLQKGSWNEVEAAVSPAYDARAGARYLFTFEPVACDGIILTGLPGGTVYFTSVAELKVAAKTEEAPPTPPREPEITYSYADIARRLYDMEALAKDPAGEKTAQFTSYDRSSTYDSVTGSYKNWSANGDWTGYLYKQSDGGCVIAEMEGPGYINRIWMAYSWTGKIAVYIDGGETPVLYDECRKLFNGQLFDYAELGYSPCAINDNMAAFNCYVPISYNTSCKVVLYDSDTNHFGDFSYYNIGYTTLPDNCAVESFSYPLSAENAAALEAANTALAARDARPDGKTDTASHTVKAGEKQTVFAADGAGAVSFLEIAAAIEAADFQSTAVPRELMLSICFDGSSTPGVYTTLGDFFGTPSGIVPYQSYVTGVRENGEMYARWFMPYTNGIRIEIINTGASDVSLSASVTTAPLSAPAESYLRFGAEWKRMEDRAASDSRSPDSQYFYAEGKGRYVGVSMQIYQSAKSIWWGEGDDKFFIDGEKFPSWYGTGSEDYFGYAWCMPTVFSSAYHGQPLCEGNIGLNMVQDPGNKVNYRFHITDSLPFYTSFDANMEKYFGDKSVKMAATTFYYLAAEDAKSHAVNDFLPEERDFNHPDALEAALSYEGEDLSTFVLDCTSGKVELQDMTWATTGDRSWSGNKHLWWKCTAADGLLSLPIKTAVSGRYELTLRMTTAADYGQVQVLVDGYAVGNPIDCYSSTLGVTEFDVGELALSVGQHTISLQMAGKNASASNYYIGLDKLELQPNAATSDKALKAAEAAIKAALEAYTPSNQTTAKALLYALQKAAGEGFSLSWSEAFSLSPATTDQAGSIGGTIRIAYGEASTELPIRLTIPQLPPEEPDVTPGDVDNDGKVTVSDVVLLRKLITAGSWTEREFAAGNVDNTDNTLTVSDVVTLRALIVAQ